MKFIIKYLTVFSKNIAFISIIFFAASIRQNLSAQILVYADDSSGALNMVAANATGTPFTRVNGARLPGSPCQFGYSSDNYTTTTSYSSTLAAIEVTVAANAGDTLNVTGFQGDLRRSNTGPASLMWAYSVDGGTNWITQDSAQTNPVASCGSGSTLTWDTALTIGYPATLMFRIYGYNATGTTGTEQLQDFSINGTVTPATATCFVPVALSSANISYDSAILYWSEVAGALSYTIQYRLVGTVNWSTTTSTSDSVVISGLLADTTYEFEVQTICASGISAFSAAFSFTTPVVNCSNAINATAQLNTAVSCAGATDGAATVHAHGNNGPFTFVWSSIPVQTDSTLTNVASGNYNVTITDANACSITASITISSPAPIIITTNVTGINCSGGNTGSISTTVTGGTGNYQYLWNSVPAQTGDTAGNLAAGNYTVTVTDANSCTSSATASISQAAQLTITGNVTNIQCFNESTGAVTANATGGSGNYQYVWSTIPQQTNATANHLSAGIYIVTVTDANNCTGTASFTISQPATGINISIATITTGCGTNTGSATATATAGNAPYTYLWNDGTTLAGDSNLAAGNYLVTVTDASGCSATQSAIINSSSGPDVTASTVNTTCGNANGIAIAHVSSGTPPYIYLWNNGDTTLIISSLAAGIYVVTVTDAAACNSISTATVNPSSGVTLSTNTSVAACGNNVGSASVSVLTGASPYICNWSNGGNSTTINGLSAGNYNITVSDAGGCSASASVAVASSPELISQFNAINDSCFNQTSGSVGTQVISGTPPYSYAWNTGGTTSSLSNLGAGTYTVTITDSAGCSAIDTAIVLTPAALQIFTSSTNSTNGQANGAARIDSITGGTLPYGIIQWSNGIAANTDTGLVAGTYTVTVTDQNGCSQTATVVVDNITGISNLNNEGISIYPNPLANGNWQLQVSEKLIGNEFEILDVSGKSIFNSQIKNSKSEIEINIEIGVYMLRIYTTAGCIVKKLVKL